MKEYAIEGNFVRIQNVAPCWNGKTGRVVRWVNDDWYLVEVEGKELVLDMSRSEMVKIESV